MKYSSYTDVDLTTLLSKGDQAAYVEIYDRFQGLLFLYACKVTQDEKEAEDIVQEVFLYLWDKRYTIAINSSIADYLYAAVRFKFFNLLDKKKVRTDYQQSLGNYMEQHESITDYLVREKELRRLIEEEVGRLPAKMREIFELSRNEYLSHREIAEKLQLSEKTVKNQINNALSILRKKFPPPILLLFFF
ncbi:RNA polymerase sigma-70 factor [Sphingobacterium lumbrici]|uniref:RNA polymerase sigma-70 factor n=1 Tax=Sphingobacterium lumbrici TaxID=2559600 RepID=UPI00112A18C9|nr:RNA polymerase sigma-70 factor [Sphingobacterium lumbrici]